METREATDRAKAGIVELVCQQLACGNHVQAKALAREKYPFVPSENVGRRYSEYQMMRIFARDGFVDRYSGQQLVFPGTLRLLSALMPEEFPAHPNWKMSASHGVYWELFPTIDHVVPVARGGADDESNWITTSMLRNAAKAHWTLTELGWALHESASLAGWDGLTQWFLAYTQDHPELCNSGYLKRWRGAAKRVLGEHSAL